jgi:hypothetical protein
VAAHGRGDSAEGETDMATGCLDSQQNEVSCSDADCTYGNCGDVTTVNSQTGNNACLDSAQNTVQCTDPACIFGDCISTTGKSAQVTGAVQAAAASGSGPSLASTISSLGSIAAATYAQSTAPQSTLKVGGLSLAAPTGSTTLLIVAAVAIVGFLAFRKK